MLREQAEANSALHSTSNLLDLSYDGLQLLLSKDDVAFSEFELLQMTRRWCIKHECSTEDLFAYFDFSKLTDEQKQC